MSDHPAPGSAVPSGSSGSSHRAGLRTATIAFLAAAAGAALAVPLTAVAGVGGSAERGTVTTPAVLCVARDGAVRVLPATGSCKAKEKAVVVPAAGPFGNDTSVAFAGDGSECTVAEIRLTAGSIGNGLPAAGQELRIADYQALYSLIGNRFGGDGQTTFRLPDLRSAAPDGTTYTICDLGVYPGQR